MNLLDWILYALLALNAAYILIFALASRFRKTNRPVPEGDVKRMACLVPAYKEDTVILECVRSVLAQDYPVEAFTVVVISDHMSDATNQALSALPIRLIVAQFEKSTKSKALNLAMSTIEDHDIALILDADNTLDPDFLSKINRCFQQPGTSIVQAHRTAKNLNTDLAYLDAVSEEINNSIFRQGHVNLGLSASFIGSGMAFEYGLFKREMAGIDAVGGFDRHLMLSMLKKGYHVGYLPDAYVYDEKVQNSSTFSNQRKRWLSAQFHYVGVYFGEFPKQLLRGNWDFCDMYLQQLVLPRVILAGFTFLGALVVTLIDVPTAVKWWWLFAAVAMALLVSIPKNLLGLRMLKSITALPGAFFRMFLNFFKLKGANRHFIHTPHGTR